MVLVVEQRALLAAAMGIVSVVAACGAVVSADAVHGLERKKAPAERSAGAFLLWSRPASSQA